MNLELEQPNFGLMIIPDDHVQSQNVQPELQSVEFPYSPTIQVKNDVVSENMFLAHLNSAQRELL